MKRILIVLVIIATISCKKSKTPAAPETPPSPPAPAVLVAPALNAPCNEGQVVSATESTVPFSWNAATNAESYDVYIKNLLTNSTSTHSTTATQLSVKLLRGTPYSWYVLSKTSKVGTTAQSATWKFYNAGEANVSYAPYPADNLVPAKNASITAVNGKVSLSWVGEDADNDIKAYDVHVGTSAAALVKIQSDIAATTVSDVAVVSGTTYYWKVYTKDHKGNISASETYNFTVN